MCTALVVGNVIGIGIFVLPAALAPYGLNAIAGWLITIVGCAFLAITFARLARTFPQDDGPYGYTKRAFGEGMAFTVMWCYLVATWVTNATIAMGVVGYLTVLKSVPGEISPAKIKATVGAVPRVPSADVVVADYEAALRLIVSGGPLKPASHDPDSQ